ncbi:hypothetical protein EV177_003833, partial [Coemansia sp. RSA 1804]
MVATHSNISKHPALSKAQQELLDQTVLAFAVCDDDLAVMLNQMVAELKESELSNAAAGLPATGARIPNAYSMAGDGSALGIAIDASGKRIRISSTRFIETDSGKQMTSESVATQ